MLIMLNKVRVLTAVLALAVGGVFAQPAAAVTQSTSPAGFSTCCWSQINLGSITLAANSRITDLTSSIDIVDQGYGGQDPQGNQVQLVLFDGNNGLVGLHVAGGLHEWSHQDFKASISELDSLNSALATINWSTSPTVTMQMIVYPLGYPGWALQGQNATFSVTSGAVPEPATWAMMLIGFGTIGYAMRRPKVMTKVSFA
jgi:hypothetical protein